MNRHSLFFRLNLLFLTVLGILLWLGFTAYTENQRSREKTLVTNFLFYEKQIRRILLTTPPSQLLPHLQSRGVFPLATLADELPVPRRLFYPDPPSVFGKNTTERLRDGRLKVYENGQKLYFVFSGPRTRHIIATDLRTPDIHQTLLYGLAVLLLFVVLYLSIRETLQPLRKLCRAIERFGDGEIPCSLRSDKKDEIATIANRFDEAIQKIQAMREARNLFMRNIMHELKTPITKGKLSVALMEESEEEKVLRRAFERMEELITQLAEVERFTSNSFSVNPIPYSMGTLIQEASARLFLPKPVPSACEEKHTYMVDKELMTIVVKNLIDNALKYGKEGSLRIVCKKKGTVRFENEGAPLRAPFEKLIEPFAKGDPEESRKSFGLGLYIIHTILQAHGARFNHRYEAGRHIFTIEGLKPSRSPWRSDD